jgi:hypothetical protein
VFRLTCVGPQTFALRAFDGRYLTALGGAQQEIRADAATRGAAETFSLVPRGGGMVALQTRENRFVNVRHPYTGGPMASSSVVSQDYALFQLVLG